MNDYAKPPVTGDIESAQAAVDEYGGEHFPTFHSVTDDGEYSLHVTVSREFDVAQLMTGIGVDVDPAYEYQPSPFIAADDRSHYECAYAMTDVPEYWDKLDDIGTFPDAVVRFGAPTVLRALCILADSGYMGDLLHDYFALEREVGSDLAEVRLSEYMRLLDTADRAYRAAGWEL